MRKSSIKKAFGVLIKSRFVEMFGDPIKNPNGWEIVTIGDVVTDVRYGTSRPAVEGGQYPYLRMNNITSDGQIDLADLKYIDIPDNEIEKCVVHKGDVLFNRTNSIDLVGKTAVYNLPDDMVIAGYIIRVRLNNKLLPEVLSQYMNLKVLKDILRNMAKGAVNQANINAQELQNIKIYIPNMYMQKQFVLFLEQVDKSKVAIQKCFIITGNLGETKMNDFIKELQDLRYLDWENKKISIGTLGSFLKAYEEKEGIRIYYKMSNYDSYRGIFGHECVNELIVSRLLDILEIPHLSYQLVLAKLCVDEQEMEGYIARSVNFRKENEKKIVFDTYYELHREKKESPLEFAKRYGWEQYVYQMFVVDYLICNRDRHGANIEVLIDEKEKPRLAPLFDHGLSLLFSCYDNLEIVRKFDILEDRAVNNFLGSKSLEYNLQLLPKGQKFFSGVLKEDHKEILMEGLEQVLSKEYLDKIWEMIWERWKRYVEVCN